jgi:hypothetical protein
MLTCPVCSFENDPFAITCLNCKGFLQNRIPNLNLFETAWGILEKPRATFRTIAIADHKNFALTISVLVGIRTSFFIFSYVRVGDSFDSLLDLTLSAVLLGVVAGVVLGPMLSLIVHTAGTLFRGKAKFRSSFGAFAYSLIPIVLSLLLIVPIQLLTFGMYFFTANPHPALLKPFSFYALLSLDVTAVLWSALLLILGITITQGLSALKSVVVLLLSFGVVMVIAYYLVSSINLGTYWLTS